MSEYPFQARLAAVAADVAAVLDDVLPATGDAEEDRLFDAMRYATLGGGKRLRPFLVVAGADMFDDGGGSPLRVAAAVEMLHTYSLIHDDLPCMDDDDLRRGQPTVHVRYDEATAVLAGDALLTLAFEVLADPATSPSPSVRADLVAALARAAGADGMVGGQMLDLLGENQPLDEAQIIRMQRKKTGAIIAFSSVAGAILAEAPAPAREALDRFAHALGLAFQIVDDLLDVRGSSAELGKTAGKDEAQGKATFVSLLGIDGAETRARALAREALDQLEMFGEKAEALRALTQFVISRRS